MEVIPTLTKVFPLDSSLINTKYNDFGILSNFFFFSTDLFLSFWLTYSFAFSRVLNSLTSRYGLIMNFLNRSI